MNTDSLSHLLPSGKFKRKSSSKKTDYHQLGLFDAPEVLWTCPAAVVDNCLDCPHRVECAA